MKFLIATLFCLSGSANALISPTWSANSNFKAALEGDSCFTVQDPITVGTVQKIVVQSCSDEKAQAWETIVATAFRKDYAYVEFHGTSGGVKPMAVTGATPKERVASLARIFNIALGANPNLNAVMQFDPNQCPFCRANIVLEMKPKVIQVFMDDLSDPWGQHNKTAQDHFAALLNLQFDDLKVLTTTTKKP